jgi:hypothetical protein
MGAFTYRAERLVTLESAGVVRLDHPSEAIIYTAKVSRSEVSAFNASLHSQLFSSSSFAVYQAVKGNHNRVRLLISRDNPFKIGDFVTVANVHASYNGTSVYVVESNADWIELTTPYDVTVTPTNGTVVRATPTWAQVGYTVVEETAADDGIAVLMDGSTPLIYECSEKPDRMLSNSIYVSISAAGTYMITILGRDQVS